MSRTSTTPTPFRGKSPFLSGLTGINTVRAARVMRMQGSRSLQLARDEIALEDHASLFRRGLTLRACGWPANSSKPATAELAKSRNSLNWGLKSAAPTWRRSSRSRRPDDYLLTQQENNLALAEIALAEGDELPGRPAAEGRYGTGNRDAGRRCTPSARCFDNALEEQPKAVAAARRAPLAAAVLYAKAGNLYPSLYVGGGYSDQFLHESRRPVALPHLSNQFRDNRGFMSRPSCRSRSSGLARRTSVNRACNNWRIAEQNRTETLRTLQSEVAQAYQQMLGYGKEFVQASKKSDAARLAYEAVSGKVRTRHGLGPRPADGGRQNCSRPVRSGCAPDCSISSRCGSWPITTASR